MVAVCKYNIQSWPLLLGSKRTHFWWFHELTIWQLVTTSVAPHTLHAVIGWELSNVKNVTFPVTEYVHIPRSN